MDVGPSTSLIKYHMPHAFKLFIAQCHWAATRPVSSVSNYIICRHSMEVCFVSETAITINGLLHNFELIIKSYLLSSCFQHFTHPNNRWMGLIQLVSLFQNIITKPTFLCWHWGWSLPECKSPNPIVLCILAGSEPFPGDPITLSLIQSCHQ